MRLREVWDSTEKMFFALSYPRFGDFAITKCIIIGKMIPIKAQMALITPKAKPVSDIFLFSEFS